MVMYMRFTFNHNKRKMIALSPKTHSILKKRGKHLKTMEGVILELLESADKYDRVCHKGKYGKGKK